MIDVISYGNYKILSDEELLEQKKYIKEQLKDCQNILLKINRAIKARKIKDGE